MAFLTALLRNAFFSFLGHVQSKALSGKYIKSENFLDVFSIFFSTLPKLFQI